MILLELALSFICALALGAAADAIDAHLTRAAKKRQATRDRRAP